MSAASIRTLGLLLFWGLRLGLGALFLVTGVLKLGDPAAFATEIHNYELAPALAPWMAAVLPTLEIVLGLALIAGTRPWVRAAALATAGLMLVFTVAVASAVARGIDVSCGCFGAGSGAVSPWTVVRDVLWLGAAGLLYGMSGPARRAEG